MIRKFEQSLQVASIEADEIQVIMFLLDVRLPFDYVGLSSMC